MTRADCLESKKPHVEAILRTSIFPSTALKREGVTNKIC